MARATFLCRLKLKYRSGANRSLTYARSCSLLPPASSASAYRPFWQTRIGRVTLGENTIEIFNSLSELSSIRMNDRMVSAAPSPIVGRALLVTSDASLAHQLKAGMSRFSISADVCSEPALSGNLVNTRKFEAIVVDLKIGQFAVDFLERVRQSPSNHHSVTFAIADPEVDVRFESNFVLHKPLTEDGLAGTLKAALGLIIRDYRRYFRCTVTIPLTLEMDGPIEVPCETLNISEGGVALTTPVILKPDSRVKLIFALPEDPIPFHLEAEVCWCDNQSRAGMQFGTMSPQDLLRLQTWLSRTIEKSLPESVARFFEKQ